MGIYVRRWLVVVGLGIVAAAPALVPPASAAAPKVGIRADNFRFCPTTSSQCLPTDGGGAVTVAPGTTVTWTYTDPACHVVLPCPGHNVRFGKSGGATRKKDGVVLYRR